MFDVDFWILFGPGNWRSKSVFACSWLEPLIHIRRCICLDYNWERTVKKKEYNVLIHWIIHAICCESHTWKLWPGQMITVRQSLLANSDSLVTLLRGSSLKNINIYWTFKKKSQNLWTLKFDLNTETHHITNKKDHVDSGTGSLDLRHRTCCRRDDGRWDRGQLKHFNMHMSHFITLLMETLIKESLEQRATDCPSWI